MKRQYLEGEVSRSLRAISGIWAMKVPDTPRYSGGGQRFSVPRYVDFLALYRGHLIAIECKQSSVLTSFPLSLIRPLQIEALGRIERAGGTSFFLVNIRTLRGQGKQQKRNATFALGIDQIIEWYYQANRASIPMDWIEANGICVPRIKLPTGKYGWDVRKLPPLSEAKFIPPATPQLTF